VTKEDRRIILSCFANGFEFRKNMEGAKIAEIKTLCGTEVFTVDYMNKAFADVMECTRCHEERSSDEYCSKWEAKQ